MSPAARVGHLVPVHLSAVPLRAPVWQSVMDMVDNPSQRPATAVGVPIERRGDFVVTMYGLEDEVCRQLLVRSRFGRVGFVGSNGPEVLPVNAMFADGDVLFRTAAGSPLDRWVDGHVVAFEVDHTDPVAETGWSVLVRGRGSRLDDPARVAALDDTEVHPWAPRSNEQWMAIRPETITGRLIRRQRLASDAGEPLPSMPPG